MLKQVCNLYPGLRRIFLPHLVNRLAQEHGVDKKSRTFTPWSHVVALLYVHLTHAMGLNDVCDSFKMHKGALATIRGATPPARNNLSYSKIVRVAAMAKELHLAMIDCLIRQSPAFALSKIRSGYLRRFRRAIHTFDSTTIILVANCLDRAKQRRQKTAAKCHLRLNMQSILPSYGIIENAIFHDARKAWDPCASLQKGEIVAFDKAYVDFTHLHELTERGVAE